MFIGVWTVQIILCLIAIYYNLKMWGLMPGFKKWHIAWTALLFSNISLLVRRSLIVFQLVSGFTNPYLFFDHWTDALIAVITPICVNLGMLIFSYTLWQALSNYLKDVSTLKTFLKSHPDFYEVCRTCNKPCVAYGLKPGGEASPEQVKKVITCLVLEENNGKNKT